MEYVSGSQTNGAPMPPGVTAITDIKNQKRVTKTLSKAVSLHLEGKPEGAGRLLSKEIEPKHRTASFNLGVCHGNLKQWSDAAAAFRRAFDADATRPESVLGLGIALIHDGQPAEALPPLEKYLSLHPDHEQALFGQAVALQQTGKHAAAVELYRKVLARNPRCEEALSNLVAVFLEKKDNASVRRYADTVSYTHL